ncbi:MAG: quinone-dependent dihydroorotate dehydrogenase [Pyrinomonadaceae bacterium]
MPQFYENIFRPLLFRLDPEAAHEAGGKMLAWLLQGERAQRLAKKRYGFAFDPPLERFGLKFSNPVGIAAGFDKNGTLAGPLSALGFGFVEVGTVTLRPQEGNPRPRLFRLPEDRALVNRLGFNNDGAKAVAERLARLDRNCVIGVNIGKNRDVPNEEAAANYVETFEIVHRVADYITVNISSPNTPGLRELQNEVLLSDLLTALQSRNREMGVKPLLVKVAPDLDDDGIDAIAEACVEHAIAGIIATNTTVSRDGLRTRDPERFGSGGLSGRPLAARTDQVISRIFRRTSGRLPIIGVGGIFSAEDAFEKVRCGASLLQAYTGFVYGGPGFAREVNLGLLRLLEEHGFEKLDDAVGSGNVG